jgi:hypothetical protein
VSLLGRFQREEPAPVIHVPPPVVDTGFGVISGQQVGVGLPEGYVGSYAPGRSASEENLAACRRWLLEGDARDFRRIGSREVVDQGTGLVFEVIDSDPLLAEDPAAACDLFYADEDAGVIRFLRRTGQTLHDLEAAALEADRARAKSADELQRWRSKQKLTVLTVEDLLPGMYPTLKAAAREIVEAGGKVERGEHGSLVVSVPQQLHRVAPGDFGTAILEKESRLRLARCAEALSLGRSVVLAALERDDFVAALPDRVPAIGEGGG